MDSRWLEEMDIQERSDAALALLERDPAIDRYDLLAAVVWPGWEPRKT